jgi:hypothetical protein
LQHPKTACASKKAAVKLAIIGRISKAWQLPAGVPATNINVLVRIPPTSIADFCKVPGAVSA